MHAEDDLIATPEEDGPLEAAREHAERLAGLGSWAWSPATGEVIWSDNLFRLYGFEPGSVEPSADFWSEHAHPGDRERARAMIDAARYTGTLDPVELRIVQPDGTVRHLRVTAGVAPARRGGRRWLVGAAYDVTDQRAAQRELSVHDAVTSALADWTSLEPGAWRLLGSVAAALGYSAGVLWVPDGGALTARVAWTDPTLNSRAFERATLAQRPPFGIGLPGRAWQAATAVASTADELHSGVAVPVICNGDAIAVLSFHADDDAELSAALARTLTCVGTRLAAFLARRPRELQSPRLSPREIEVVQLAADGCTGRQIAERLVLSPATIKTHFENAYQKLGVSDRAAAVAQALRAGLIN